MIHINVLRSRMMRRMDLLDVLSVQVSVDLCRRDIHVAEHFLDGSQVGSPFDEVGSEGVTERVRMHLDIALDAGLVDNVPYGHPGKPAASPVQEEDVLALVIRPVNTNLPLILRHPLQGIASQGNDPFLGPLAEHAQKLSLPHHIALMEGTEFADAESAGI